MTIADYRSKTKEQLQKSITDLKKDITKSVEDVYLQNEKNVRKPRFMRKQLAQILTVLREKEILEE